MALPLRADKRNTEWHNAEWKSRVSELEKKSRLFREKFGIYVIYFRHKNMMENTQYSIYSIYSIYSMYSSGLSRNALAYVKKMLTLTDCRADHSVRTSFVERRKRVSSFGIKWSLSQR